MGTQHIHSRFEEFRSREFAAWRLRVEAVLKRRYKIDLSDIGFTEEKLLDYWKTGYNPMELSDWIGSKFDLIEDENFRRGQFIWSRN